MKEGTRRMDASTKNIKEMNDSMIRRRMQKAASFRIEGKEEAPGA